MDWPLHNSPKAARALLVSHRGKRCGVWQFGARLHRTLQAAEGLDWHYAECACLEEFQAVADELRPDVILANLHPATLAWARNGVPFGDALTVAVFHEASQASVAMLQAWPFDLLLCPDPTLLPRDPRAVPVPRFIPTPLMNLPPLPEVFTVGSFGFGTPGKGFDRLCAIVDQQFETARIRINIPPHDHLAIVPAESVRMIVEKCRQAVTKPGIELDFTHHFFDDAALLDFLSENTLNAFLYDDAPGRGISSCTDYALAAGRPIAVSHTTMFRHLTGVNPSICVEDRPLAAIAATGLAPLAHHRAAYEERAAGAAWNAAILDALASRRAAYSLPDGRGFNKLLDDRSRAAYADALQDLAALAPDMLARKIERANIQQAFALDAVRRLAARFAAPRILAIGSYEDTAVASLRALGYRVEEIDPQVNGTDLNGFYRAPGAGVAYDIVLCVSVLEHVPDDEAFVRQAAALLVPGGIAVFTVDFSERYPETGRCPAADRRLYTARDLRGRLLDQLPGYGLLDPSRWDEGEEDFEYEGCRYAFATWVFTRLPPAVARHGWAAEEALGGPPWKALLRRAEAERAADATEYEASRSALERRHATETGELQDQLAAVSRRAAIAEARLQDLRLNLRLPDPPIALRLTLPAARLIQALRYALLGKQPAPAPISTPSGPDVQATAPVLPLPPLRRASLARKAARLAYFVVRPVARPVLHRVRTFMTSPQTDAINALRSELLNRAVHHHEVPVHHGAAADAEMRRLAAEIESAILTLAMEARARTPPAEP